MARQFALVSIVALLVTDGATGQDVRSTPDSVYTWLLMERSTRPDILVEAQQFDRDFYQVFMDSLSIEGTTVYRLFLGRYDGRDAALRAEVAIPLTMRRDAQLMIVPRDDLGVIPPGAAVSEDLSPSVSDTAKAVPDSVGVVEGPENEVNVYLDCGACDFEHVRREVAFVNWVRDRQDAEVHLLVTTRSAAAGREYTLYFIGLQTFSSLSDTLRFVSSSTDTYSERRLQVAQRIRLGLVRYVGRTRQADHLDVVYSTRRRHATPEGDPWKSWTFRMSGNGSYNEEAATKSYNWSGTVGVNRLTDDWKIQIAANSSYWHSEFELQNSVLTSTRRSGSVSGQVVKSLAGRWSAGLFATASTSSFRNTNFSATLAPALEFNVFPYSESTRREFRFAYYLNLRSFDYEEITVFEKTGERVLHHDLQAILQSREPWGSAYLSLSVSNYLTDFEDSLTDLYRIESYSYLEVRLVRGLSVWVEVTASRIRDQIFLPLKTATEEEILLGTIQLPTDFSFRFSGGLTFTFGSIYNNVVNARFGS